MVTVVVEKMVEVPKITVGACQRSANLSQCQTVGMHTKLVIVVVVVVLKRVV